VRGGLSTDERARLQTIGYVAGAAIAQNTDLAGADPKERLAVPEALDRADSLGTARRRAEAYAVLAPFQERGAMFRSIRASAAATMPARAAFTTFCSKSIPTTAERGLARAEAEALARELSSNTSPCHRHPRTWER
jgi:hypothetical protein